MRHHHAAVVIIGAGPVGITLAMDLAWRGISVIVAEARARDEPPSPKCNHVSARSMEIFRRLGVAQAVRNAGLPADFPNDISFRTTAIGREFARIPIPCRRDRYSARGGADTDWPTPEPPHRINQIFLEPILIDHATAMPGLILLNRTRVTGFTQDATGIVATAENPETSEAIEITGKYLIGCEGAQSPTRRAIGARFEGDAEISRTQSTYIRAPDLLGRMQAAPAWSNQILNPRRSANMFAIDGRETWLIHNYLRPGEDFSSLDRDGCIRAILGGDIPYHVIGQEDWIGRRLLANTFRDRRAFICGDAAHIWVPFAGYGMNAGIADAITLSWQLAAVLTGWAAPEILDAYMAERHPITEQVSRYAMNTAMALARQRAAIPADIEDDSSAGAAARAAFGATLVEINTAQFCCGGLNFGSYYDASPIIAYDGEAPPAYTMDQFTPSTVPGCRTPHIWLPDGKSLYDALGPDFTLLRFDPSTDIVPILDAARVCGMKLAVLDVPRIAPYRENLVLSRPDQHIAWRGNHAPAHARELIDRVRGYRSRQEGFVH